MKLLKSIAEGIDLKSSDGSDAGKNDIVKGAKSDDIGFSLMRNTINRQDSSITGSAVADYLERAEEINNEVESVPYGLETNDGEIIKVWVNAEQAAEFEEAMKKLLGVEDDIEEAINKLAMQFDIVDVVWPGELEPENIDTETDATETDADVDPLSDDDEMDVVAEYDPLKP